MSNHAAERERLKRRLSLLSKDLSKKLRKYRHDISKPSAVERRGVEIVVVYSNKGNSVEAADILGLCHEFLDQHHIPADIETANNDIT